MAMAEPTDEPKANAQAARPLFTNAGDLRWAQKHRQRWTAMKKSAPPISVLGIRGDAYIKLVEEALRAGASR